jgi:flagellar motor switch protein FliM
VEQFFKQVSERFRAKIVSWSSQDIPTRIAAVEASSMHELFNNQEFKDSVIYSAISIRGVPVEGCLMIQFPLFARLLEVSMGGEGGSDFSAPIRSLTLVEDIFAGRLVKLIKEQLEGSWSFGRKGIEVRLVKPSLNQPAFGPKAKTMEVITATIDIGPLSSPYGLMSIALPSQMFERAFGTSLVSTPDEEVTSFENVLDVKIDLVAELQRITVTVNELKALEEGSFIPLHTQMDVCLRVNGKKRFTGVFGDNNGMRSVQVTEKCVHND